MESITQIILAVVSGGVLQAILAYFISRKKENRVDFELMLKTLNEENQRLRLHEDELNEKVNQLTIEVNKLQSKIATLESNQTPK